MRHRFPSLYVNDQFTLFSNLSLESEQLCFLIGGAGKENRSWEWLYAGKPRSSLLYNNHLIALDIYFSILKAAVSDMELTEKTYNGANGFSNVAFQVSEAMQISEYTNYCYYNSLMNAVK